MTILILINLAVTVAAFGYLARAMRRHLDTHAQQVATELSEHRDRMDRLVRSLRMTMLDRSQHQGQVAGDQYRDLHDSLVDLRLHLGGRFDETVDALGAGVLRDQRMDVALTALRTRVDQGLLASQPVAVAEDAIADAVRSSCQRAGLGVVDAARDLSRTGKLHEVLAHAAETLGVRPPLQTVGDVIAHFQTLNQSLHP